MQATNTQTEIKNIEAGVNMRIKNKKQVSQDENGQYLVRFYSDVLGRYCYVNEGSAVSWEIWDEYNQKSKKIFATITSKNSEKYYVDHRFIGDKKPTSNHDIDHFLAMKNGSILATQINSWNCYFRLNNYEYENEILEF
ncbi:hypothetical protein [Campylobacter sp. FOBRC14]|uniref:hypothetical protein n=1 Tax=Campylobacter sp. FOBRC14 TaxID=936554 RepID=UPI00027A34D6|nr:hypothetical protein [Campylobacter sp. FOBRC14]EJP75094.1 hypothetical protein HMPREF1139_1475 [Campylobacter sp. FOBRC14]